MAASHKAIIKVFYWEIATIYKAYMLFYHMWSHHKIILYFVHNWEQILYYLSTQLFWLLNMLTFMMSVSFFYKSSDQFHIKVFLFTGKSHWAVPLGQNPNAVSQKGLLGDLATEMPKTWSGLRSEKKSILLELLSWHHRPLTKPFKNVFV